MRTFNDLLKFRRPFLLATFGVFGAFVASVAPVHAAKTAAPQIQAQPQVQPQAQLQVQPQAQASAPAQPNAQTQPQLSGFELMETKLDAALKDLEPAALTPDIYPLAKSRIHEVKSRLILYPKSKQAAHWRQACSLFTESALLQMQTLAKQAERIRLQEQRAVTLSEINAIHVAINKLERGYASSLKSDLEEQKRRTAAAKDEAEKRFGELNSALIQVHKDARGTIISMSDILFDVGKATLTENLKINLAKIAGILTIYKDANVVVEGHTDNVGGEEYNQKLSEKRASNVMEYLVAPGGVAATRLTSAGFGFSKPIADNESKEGKQKNRRVDLVILDKKAAP